MWARLLRIPRPYLHAGILVFASIGAYATDGSAMGLYLLLVMGVLGVLMRRFGLPIVPIIIGVILGPLAEQQLRRAMQLSDGDPSALVSSPLSIGLYVLLGLAVVVPLVWRYIAARKGRGGEAVGVGTGGTPRDVDHVGAQADTDAEAELSPTVDSRREGEVTIPTAARPGG